MPRPRVALAPGIREQVQASQGTGHQRPGDTGRATHTPGPAAPAASLPSPPPPGSLGETLPRPPHLPTVPSSLALGQRLARRAKGPGPPSPGSAPTLQVEGARRSKTGLSPPPPQPGPPQVRPGLPSHGDPLAEPRVGTWPPGDLQPPCPGLRGLRFSSAGAPGAAWSPLTPGPNPGPVWLQEA